MSFAFIKPELQEHVYNVYVHSLGDTSQTKGGRHQSESDTAHSAGSQNSPPRNTATATRTATTTVTGLPSSYRTPDEECTPDGRCRRIGGKS